MRRYGLLRLVSRSLSLIHLLMSLEWTFRVYGDNIVSTVPYVIVIPSGLGTGPRTETSTEHTSILHISLHTTFSTLWHLQHGVNHVTLVGTPEPLCDSPPCNLLPPVLTGRRGATCYTSYNFPTAHSRSHSHVVRGRRYTECYRFFFDGSPRYNAVSSSQAST